MEDFTYCNSARIVFGKTALSKLKKLISDLGGKKIFLHYGRSSAKENGVLDKVKEELDSQKLSYVELGGVEPNPRISLVLKGIETVKREAADFILAVGGGSVIDSAKAIAVGAVYNGNLWDDMFMKGLNPVKRMPLGVVLIMAATGSESSNSCVISNVETGFKRSIKGEALIPDFAVCNPEFTYTVSAAQTAYGACDILSHLMERYFTLGGDNDLTDELLIGAMQTVLRFAPIAIKNPTDYNARAQLMLTGTFAHNGSLGVGRTGDWASHKLEHELSAAYDIPHGMGLAIVFPAWIKYNYKLKPEAFEKMGKRVMGLTGKITCEKFVDALCLRFNELGLPTSLKEIGISLSEKQISDMAYKCRLYRGDIGEFNKLGAEDIAEIFRLMQ